MEAKGHALRVLAVAETTKARFFWTDVLRATTKLLHLCDRLFDVRDREINHEAGFWIVGV